MNTNQHPEKEEVLNGLLRQWTVSAQAPPRFQEQVWYRIALAEQRSQSPTGSWLARLLEVVLPRPQVALAYVLVLLGLGIAAGSLTAHETSNRLESELSHRYVRSVDPYYADFSAP